MESNQPKFLYNRSIADWQKWVSGAGAWMIEKSIAQIAIDSIIIAIKTIDFSIKSIAQILASVVFIPLL